MKTSLFKKAALAALCLSIPLVALAQEATPEPICLEFADQPTAVRVGYYMGEGLAFAESRDFSQAVRSFTCVIDEIDPQYLDAHLNRGLAHVSLRQYDAAIEDYTNALTIAPDYIPAYNNRGIIYTAQGEYDLAIEDFTRAIQLDADYIIAYNNRGVAQAAKGEYDLAIGDFEAAIAINEDYAQPYGMLGIVYSAKALDNYNLYLGLAGGMADRRIQGAASSLASRFTFELRFDDGTWLLTADFTDREEVPPDDPDEEATPEPTA